MTPFFTSYTSSPYVSRDRIWLSPMYTTDRLASVFTRSYEKAESPNDDGIITSRRKLR